MKQKIIFITELKNPITSKASSTTIMINNLLTGLVQVAERLHLIAFIDNLEEYQDFERFYEKKVGRITLYKSQLCNEAIQRKYMALLQESISWFSRDRYRELAKKIRVNDGDIIISHSPSIESVLLARELKKERTRYIQFWSDPLAISGIYPENLNVKRIPAWLSEKKSLSYADEIVYGTKILYEFQKKLYSRYEKKMRYVDICYAAQEETDVKKAGIDELDKKPLVFGYFGNYYSQIRNIDPLYNAFVGGNNKLIICGNGDKEYASSREIEVMDRVSVTEADRLENSVDVIVCILNKNCVQVPGKIFYKTYLKKDILIILDGKYKKMIRDYLETFERFTFCDNNIESIRGQLQMFSSSRLLYHSEGARIISPLQMAEMLLREDKWKAQ